MDFLREPFARLNSKDGVGETDPIAYLGWRRVIKFDFAGEVIELEATGFDLELLCASARIANLELELFGLTWLECCDEGGGGDLEGKVPFIGSREGKRR